MIPSDKAFSPSLFLTLVHGGTPFDELRVGLDRLKEHLTQQSRRRENLVRSHFGLFVQCADGLEWLKAYHQGGNIDLHTFIDFDFYLFMFSLSSK